MRKIGRIALLSGMLGMAGEAAAVGASYAEAAGNRGLSPIISLKGSDPFN